MDYIDFFYNRLTQLRLEKGVSSRDMRLSLGQSESYINKIENRRTLPSLTGFLYICEYFNITPQEFFDPENVSPSKTNTFLEEFQKLTNEQKEHIIGIMKYINDK